MKFPEGAFYRKRNGDIVGPVKKICDTSWPFWIPTDNYRPYRKDGRAELSGWIDSDHDLIAEEKG